jgi:SAM-dependent methyltransferase
VASRSTHPLSLYGDGLRGRGATRAVVRLRDGTVHPLALERWLAPADETDERILASVEGPVLDVGCGPGRHLHALAKRGVFALGVDLSPIAVDLARGRGGNAIVGSIFDELPGAGTWRSALLLDGNIGIGGVPERLLSRVGALLSDCGEVLVELGPPDTPSGATLARIETADEVSGWFPWARVAACDIDGPVGSAGLEIRERWSQEERWFARLARRG